VLARPAIASVIVAARTHDRLGENLRAADIELGAEDFELLDRASDPGVTYPRWMVEQLDLAEDPRPRVLNPRAFADGRVRDRRGTGWNQG
jgi:hypothetical protein